MGRLKAGNVAALALGILLIGGGFARTAAAFEWDLPGERKFSIHGFYESRLMFVGSELPLNGATWSSWRHVLVTEFEFNAFPDGFGPVDSMFMFSRFLVSYDCIYTYSCGLFNSADSYGDDQRKAVRQPLSLAEDVKNNAPYFAGLLKQTYRPGSLAPAQEELNPGRRYRDCENPPGVVSNPFPLAVFCNLNNRSPLDNPNNQTGNKYWEVRAGTFHPFTRPSLIAAARSTLGTDEYTRLQSLLIDGNVLSHSQRAQYSTLLAEASETDDPALAAALQAQAASILGTPETTFDANIPELLATRPDQNRFAIIAGDMAPELLTAKWGSSRLRNMVWPFLATIDTPIRPQGYFASGGALDTIGHYDQALGENLNAIIGGLPQTNDADGTAVFTAANASRRVNPFFVGPDGLRDTSDDLPYVLTNERAQQVGYSLATPIAGTSTTDEDRFDATFGRASATDRIRQKYSLTAQIAVPSASSPGTNKVVELYGVYSSDFLINQGCGAAGGSYDKLTGQCVSAGEDRSAQALSLGCRETSRNFDALNIGVNGDGDCIELNTTSPTSAAARQARVQFEVISLLGDLNVRPIESVVEPLDPTDFRSVADSGVNNTLPARPRASDNGIDFQSPGERKQYKQYHNLVSNLDLKYSVDSLQWNHGASQREHEFAEGYLEFETAGSQIYARVGKLIVVWGKTELFRNQDRNNPLDLGYGLFTPLEEQRVGQWGVDLTFSPQKLMRVGPVEDLRLEVLALLSPFEPTDNGKCGEGSAIDIICLKSYGAMSNGLSGSGVIGEHRPYDDYSGIERFDFGARIEGRLDRFTFAVSDFWGWDDGFYLDLVQQYERTSDPMTGAPLSLGMRQSKSGCRIRTNAEGQAVGPDGNAATTGDNIFPSSGDCLLWNPPDDPNGAQTLRSPDSVAALQNVNQTLFHSLCAYTFDPDEGFCSFDRLNFAADFGLLSNVISGLGVLGSALLDGVETIKPTNADGSISVVQRGSDSILSQAFLAIEPTAWQSPVYQDLGISLVPGQASLFGCGPAYASPCGSGQVSQWANDPSIVADLTRDADLGMSKLGGIDLMNADASVVTQEFVGLKALSPGALVGTKLSNQDRLYYQYGLNYSRNGQQSMNIDADFTRQGVQISPPLLVQQFEGGEYLDLTPSEVISLGREGRAEYQIQAGNLREADSWIEPMPWTVNQEMLEKFGAIVFNTDPNNVLDLDSPLNKWNLIDPDQDPNDLAAIDYTDIDGEYCSRWMNGVSSNVATPFDLGCSGLETVSANFERLLISLEIIGADRVFDAPESLQELAYWSQANTSLQALGDPIAGPDGIFARNQYVFRDDEVDFDVLKTPAFDPNAPVDYFIVAVPIPGAADPHVAARDFLLGYDPQESCTRAFCYLEVNNVLVDPTDVKPNGSSLILAMPIGFSVEVVTVADPNNPTDPNQPPVGTGINRMVNLAKLQYLQQTEGLPTLRRLLASQVVSIDTPYGPEFVQMSLEQRTSLLGEFGSQLNRGRDMDADGSTDLDRNRDVIWDGQDDYLAGPITDDNILCGSGIPGDLLQDGVQYEPYRADQAIGSENFSAIFPNGLPPRSPVFCRGVAGLLNSTTQTLPIRKAGGDGRYGRRDFLWQGGRQVAFNYQKRNVFGFGLDFAEDTTKTSWGIEFSWMANKLIPNNTEYSGLSQTDELVLSISVDRPTFFNFLNPNRSFFLNLQMFLRYLPDYEGGRGNFDGNYAAAGGPLTGNVAFTFFTGYFQDRLAPRVTILYAPWESQGALITGLTYRWNDAFSTSIGFTQFFGHVYKQQGAYFPISQYGSTEAYTSPVFRGVAPVIDRDLAELRIRYTW